MGTACLTTSHVHYPGEVLFPFTGPGYHLRVIAATSRPNAIDPALRRVGRLDSEVAVNLPTPEVCL